MALCVLLHIRDQKRKTRKKTIGGAKYDGLTLGKSQTATTIRHATWHVHIKNNKYQGRQIKINRICRVVNSSEQYSGACRVSGVEEQTTNHEFS